MYTINCVILFILPSQNNQTRRRVIKPNHTSDVFEFTLWIHAISSNLNRACFRYFFIGIRHMNRLACFWVATMRNMAPQFKGFYIISTCCLLTATRAIPKYRSIYILCLCLLLLSLVTTPPNMLCYFNNFYCISHRPFNFERPILFLWQWHQYDNKC